MSTVALILGILVIACLAFFLREGFVWLLLLLIIFAGFVYGMYYAHKIIFKKED
jgi:hypothetical protein